MRLHKKNAQNPSLPDSVKPTGSGEHFSHFPEEDIPNLILTNETGLSLNSRLIHRQTNIAGLFNQYPIRPYQYAPSETDSAEKSKLARKLSVQITNSLRDFQENIPSDDQSRNTREVFWTTGKANKSIQSKQEKSKGDLPSQDRSIFPKAKAERFVK